MADFDWSSIIGPAISAGGSLAGGIVAGRAARGSAQTQVEAAQQANDMLRRMYEEQRGDLAPYRETGYRGLEQLAGLGDTPFTYGQYTPTETLDPNAYTFDPSYHTFDPSAYAFQYGQAPPEASQYNLPGQVNIGSGQDLLSQDPGYQWRVQQGQKALESSAASKGGLVSGAQMRAAQDYGQGLASQEYGQAYGRAREREQAGYERGLQRYGLDTQREQTMYGRGLGENELRYTRALQGKQYNLGLDQYQNQLAYQRAYQQNADLANRTRDAYSTNFGTQMGLRNQRFNELAALAGIGQTAGGQQAGLASQFGGQLAGNITSAGAAQAAGQVGGASALTSALGGIGNAGQSYNQNQILQQILNQGRNQQRYYGDEALR